ncbi:AAA family ATPase [Halobacillus sp. BBL2006]|uniref:ATP-binding protein n=1 Tax=Halobacillus sp. BBL2006 TaxID=1543706 RepID=UPI000542C7FB|nr:AAA family ATPase [Halobacillus sp. BBL2006]KHE72790.1 hypothetical protein LD39_02710 [Halobacillus sp. BBL2006]
MNVKEIHIYGFGKWQDQSFVLEEGIVNLVSGQNEAGKSTLHQFILFILFGLSPKQREYYQPKKGGAVGGKLVIDTQDHVRVTIERLHDQRNGKAVCRLENGDEYEEEWLYELLKGTTREVYASIFSFSAEDLMDLHRMSGSQLGEVLLNVGLTGSDRIYDTEKWLEKQLEQRFKPKGKKPQINKQLQVVEEVNHKRLAAEREEANYLQLQESKTKLIRDMDKHEQQIKEKRKKLFSREQLLNALPAISEYHQLQKEVMAYGEHYTFPIEGRERYRQLKENILPLESEQHLLESNITEMTERLEKLESDQAGQPALDQAKAVLLERNQYEQAVHYAEEMGSRAEAARNQLKQNLRHMDIPIDGEEVREYPLPFYIEETWADLKEEANSIQQEETQLDQSQQEVRIEQQQVGAKLKTLKNERISDQEANEYSMQIDKAYQKTSPDVIETSAIKQRHDLLLGFAVFLILAGWVGAWITSSTLLGVLSMVAGVIFISAGLRSHQSYQKNMKYSSEKSGHPSSLSMEEARQKLQQYEKNRAEYSYAKDRWKQLNQEDIRFDEKRRLLLQRKSRLEAGIQEQESLYPFLTSLHIDYWDKLFHLLIKAKEKSEEIEALAEQIESNEQLIQKILFDLEKFYKLRNWESSQKSINQKWAELQRWVKEQENMVEQISQLSHSICESKKKFHEIELRLDSYIQKREELFLQAQVEDEEAYYAKADQHERLTNNQREVHRLKQQLKEMLADSEQKEFNIWHQVPDEPMVKIEIEAMKKEMAEAENRVRALQQDLSDIKSRLMQLENSGQLSELTHQYELEKEKLREESKEWAKHQIALRLLERTKKRYMEKYLPEVIEKAAHYFSKLTGFQYKTIHLSTTERKEMKIAHNDGQLYEVQELSRGTKDQLYVALRIALGETMAETLRLPFMLDDAFVHFDQSRLKVMLEILEDVSRRHQVLLFTWRNDLGEHFKATNVITLE